MRGSIPLSMILHVGAAAALVYAWDTAERAQIFVPTIPIEVISEAELGELLSVPEMIKAEIEEPDIEELAAPDVPEELPTIEEIVPPEPAIEPVVVASEELPQIEEELPPIEVEEKPIPAPTPPSVPLTEPTPPKPPEISPEQVEDDFLAGLSGVLDKTPDQEDRKRPSEISDTPIGGARNQQRIGEGKRLSITEEAAFQAWMEKCWNWDLGVPDSDALVVRIRLRLKLDGSLAEPVEILNAGEISRSRNQYWNVAQQRARRAAEECAPYSFLDPSTYQDWQEVDLNFKPPF